MALHQSPDLNGLVLNCEPTDFKRGVPVWTAPIRLRVMANFGAVYKVAVLLLASLLVVQDFRPSQAQWAQTNGWGGAGVGKRMFTPPDLSGPCRVDPYVALLISRLAKIEAERLRNCDLSSSFGADDSK